MDAENRDGKTGASLLNELLALEALGLIERCGPGDNGAVSFETIEEGLEDALLSPGCGAPMPAADSIDE